MLSNDPESFKPDITRLSKADDYTLRYLVDHLHSARQTERWMQLLTASSAWMMVKFDRFRSDREYTNDILLVQNTLLPFSSDIQLINYLKLMTAYRVANERTTNFRNAELDLLIRSGFREEAIKVVRSRDNGLEKCSALIDIYVISNDEMSAGLVQEIIETINSIELLEPRFNLFLKLIQAQKEKHHDYAQTLSAMLALLEESGTNSIWIAFSRWIISFLPKGSQIFYDFVKKVSEIAATLDDIDQRIHLLIDFALEIWDNEPEIAQTFVMQILELTFREEDRFRCATLFDQVIDRLKIDTFLSMNLDVADYALKLLSGIYDTSLQIKLYRILAHFYCRKKAYSSAWKYIKLIKDFPAFPNLINSILRDQRPSKWFLYTLREYLVMLLYENTWIRKDVVYSLLVHVSAESDCIESVYPLADLIKDPWERSYALADLLNFCLDNRIGRISNVFELLQTSINGITNIEKRNRAQGSVVLDLSRRNEIELVQDVLSTMTEPKEINYAKVNLVNALAERGETNKALNIVQTIADPDPRASSRALESIIRHLANSSQFDQALRLSEQLDHRILPDVLSYVALKMYANEDFRAPEVSRQALQVSSGKFGISPRIAIGITEILLNQGKIDAVFNLLRAKPDSIEDKTKAKITAKLIGGLLALEDTRAADLMEHLLLQEAELIRKGHAPWAILELAIALLKSGSNNVKKVLDLISEALQNHDIADDWLSEDNTLLDVLLELVSMGNINETLNIVQSLKSETSKIHLIVEILQVLPQKHESTVSLMRDAEDICLHHQEDTWYTNNLAIIMVYEGLTERGIQLLLSNLSNEHDIRTSNYQRAFERIVSRLVELGEIKQAKELVEQIPDQVIKRETYAILAATLADAGNIQTAREILSALDERLGERGWIAVAYQMAEEKRFEDALVMLQRRVDSFRADWPRARITSKLILNGDLAPALSMFAPISMSVFFEVLMTLDARSFDGYSQFITDDYVRIQAWLNPSYQHIYTLLH